MKRHTCFEFTKGSCLDKLTRRHFLIQPFGTRFVTSSQSLISTRLLIDDRCDYGLLLNKRMENKPVSENRTLNFNQIGLTSGPLLSTENFRSGLTGPHVFHRNFQNYVVNGKQPWSLIEEVINNKYKKGSYTKVRTSHLKFCSFVILQFAQRDKDTIYQIEISLLSYKSLPSFYHPQINKG